MALQFAEATRPPLRSVLTQRFPQLCPGAGLRNGIGSDLIQTERSLLSAFALLSRTAAGLNMLNWA